MSVVCAVKRVDKIIICLPAQTESSNPTSVERQSTHKLRVTTMCSKFELSIRRIVYVLQFIHSVDVEQVANSFTRVFHSIKFL